MFYVNISFPLPEIRLSVVDWNGDEFLDLRSNQLPSLEEWSRIEIGHVEEGGNYFLSLSVGGKEVGRKDFELGRNLTDVKIYNGWASQLGFIRGLLVFDKQ